MIVAAIALASISCSEKIDTEKVLLKKENDSLRNVLTDINSKYVFDSISFKDTRSLNNTYKKGSVYEQTFSVIAYSSNAKYFVKFDSIVNGKKVNPDTITNSKGNFTYRTTLDHKVNTISAEINIENKYGKQFHGRVTDRARVKE